MTRQEVLSASSRFYRQLSDSIPASVRSTRSTHLSRAVRGFRRREMGEGELIGGAGKTLNRLLYPEGHRFSAKTELILKAACAQYLGRYPAHTPSGSEIKTALGEMQRMHRGWKEGFLNMEMCFGSMSGAIREIGKYAREHGLLPHPIQL